MFSLWLSKNVCRLFHNIFIIIFLGDMVVATKTILDLEEWDLVLAKLHRYDISLKKHSISFSQYCNSGDYFNNFFIFYSSRYHANIQQECGIIVKTIKAEMKSDLIPLAEEKSNHGKVWFKTGYDISVAQKKFGPNVSVRRIYVIKNSEKTKDRWIICGNNWNFFSDLKI